MCLGLGGSKPKPVPKEMPAPAKVAEADEIGSARAAEDEALFGGVPDLKVDRSVTGGGVDTGGAGLKMT